MAHCILNQNSRVLGLAKRSSVITEILEFLVHNEMGIIQMPCPEFTHAGILRQPKTKDEYDNVMFRRCCRKIAREIADQIQEYARSGTKTKIVIGVDGSPSCSVNRVSTGKTCKNMTGEGRVKGSGILIEELNLALTKRKITIPFHGIQYERLPKDLAIMERLLKD